MRANERGAIRRDGDKSDHDNYESGNSTDLLQLIYTVLIQS